MRLLLSSLVIFISTQSLGQHRCAQVFDGMEVISSESFHFTQDFLGYDWALSKAQKSAKKFETWKEKNPEGTVEQFVLEATMKKPVTGIRDVHKKPRFVDRHNSIGGYSELVGRDAPFTVYSRVLIDYSLRWTDQPIEVRERLMIEDMIQRNFLNLKDKSKPQFQDLARIPRQIWELEDFPLRSMMSFVLQKFEVSLKGSDFNPHIHVRLAQEIVKQGLDVYDLATEINAQSIAKVQDRILGSKAILEFMLNELNPDGGALRLEKVENFLIEKLGALEESKIEKAS